MKMDASKIERIGVNAVDESCTFNARGLTAFISIGDKMPSWDGDIIFNPNSDGSKKNLLKVSVQVKGKKANESNLKLSNIMYPVSAVDLKNYMTNNGVIFYVVLIDANNPKQFTIFYNALTPVKIQGYLSEIKANQKEKSIKFTRYPQADRDIISIIHNFHTNSRLQGAYIAHKLDSVFNVIDKSKLRCIYYSCDSILNEDKVQRLFSEDLYLYNTIDNTDFLIPLQGPVKLMEIAFRTSITASVDGVIYFKDSVIKADYNDRWVELSESIRLCFLDNFSKLEMKISPSSNVREFSGMYRFLEAMSRSKCLNLDDYEFPFPDFNINLFRFEEKYLNRIENCVLLLDRLNIPLKYDLNLSQLKDDSFDFIDELCFALQTNNSITIPKYNKASRTCYHLTLGQLKILLLLVPDKQNLGKYFVFNFFTNNTFKLYNNGKLISIYSLLKLDDYQSLSNLSLSVIFTSYKSICLQNIEHMSYATTALLYSLLYYDATRDRSDLDLISDFSKWILSHSSNDSEVDYINNIQVIKRRRLLTNDEKYTLLNMVDRASSDEVKLSIYLLLDNMTFAKFYFNRLSNEHQKVYKTWPIYYFMKDES